MQAISVQKKQSWPDLAVQAYGNIDATVQLLSDSVQTDDETDLTDACPLATVLVDDTNELMNKTALRALGGATIATMNP